MLHNRSRLVAWLLGMALMGVIPGPARAQDTADGGRRLESKPRMESIPHTGVDFQRKTPGYDLYRYANTWYLVEDGAWYRSTAWNGLFTRLEFENLPEEVATVPGGYRRSWGVTPLIVPELEGMRVWRGSFPSKPSMRALEESGVFYSSTAAKGSVDLYRYRGSWFLVEQGTWFRSDSWKGPFFSITAPDVPREVLRVPFECRRHWTAAPGL